jgi:hypothetical protein
VGELFVFDGTHWVPFEAVLVPPDHFGRHCDAAARANHVQRHPCVEQVR